MTTTSVGSVNGLQLAHGDRPGKTAQDALEDIWFTKMNTCGDLFEVSDVTRMIRDRIQGALSGIQGSVVTGGAVGGIAGLALLGPVGYIIGLLGGAIGGGAVAVDDLINDLQPLVEVLSHDGAPAVVDGVTLERSGIYRFRPLRDVINQQLKPHEVESSGIELRMMSVALDNGALVAVDEKGDIWTAARGQRLQRNGESTTLVQGVMASSAMPAMLPHEKVGSLTCVDAGIKEGVPVSVAVDDLGTSTVYAIMCSAEVAPVANAAQMSALSVFARGITLIPFVEISDDDVRPYGGWPPDVDVIVIQPSFDIHDGMVIEPGLIRIAYDYGWMRAADVLDPPPGNANAARNACDRIIRARRRPGNGSTRSTASHTRARGATRSATSSTRTSNRKHNRHSCSSPPTRCAASR